MNSFTQWQLRSHKVGVLFEDDYLIVLDKPSGILVIPDRFDPTLPNLSSLLKADGEPAYVVHRVDRETTGCVLFAKTREAHAALSAQFEERSVEKVYTAICKGTGKEGGGMIDLPLSEHAPTHTMRVDRKKGKPSQTGYSVLESFPAHTYVEVRPHTGRTHQIRVHLAAIGLPILCDARYGDGEPFFLSRVKRRYKQGKDEEKPLISRTALHAGSVTFVHPANQLVQKVESALPKDMRSTLRTLTKYAR